MDDVMTQKFVVVDNVLLQGVMRRLEELEKIVKIQNEGLSLRARMQSYCDGKGLITGPAIEKITGWSHTTLWRKIKAGDIPVTNDGGRLKMDFEEFVKWYENYLSINNGRRNGKRN